MEPSSRAELVEAATDGSAGSRLRAGADVLAAPGDVRDIALGNACSSGGIVDAARTIARVTSTTRPVVADRLALQRCTRRVIDAGLASTAHADGLCRIGTLLVARALGENTAVLDIADLTRILASDRTGRAPLLAPGRVLAAKPRVLRVGEIVATSSDSEHGQRQPAAHAHSESPTATSLDGSVSSADGVRPGE